MLIDYKLGQTSIILRVKIRNSSVSTGAGLTGLTNASSGLRIAATADNESTATAYTSAGSLIDTIATLGTYAAPTATHCRFKEVDATNHPGVYEIQLENSRFAVANAKSLLVSISGATNAAECDIVVPLRQVDPYSATGFVSSVPTVVDKAGYLLGAAGLDSVVAETGVNVRQAVALTLDAILAKLSGATTNSITIRDLNDTTNRATVGVDGNGNRTSIVVSPPA